MAPRWHHLTPGPGGGGHCEPEPSPGASITPAAHRGFLSRGPRRWGLGQETSPEGTGAAARRCHWGLHLTPSHRPTSFSPACAGSASVFFLFCGAQPLPGTRQPWQERGPAAGKVKGQHLPGSGSDKAGESHKRPPLSGDSSQAGGGGILDPAMPHRSDRSRGS